MKFLIDAQLPPALAAALRELGCDAVALRNVGLREAKDRVIWQYALQNNATNPELLDWLLPLWSGILACIEAGDQLIEVI